MDNSFKIGFDAAEILAIWREVNSRLRHAEIDRLLAVGIPRLALGRGLRHENLALDPMDLPRLAGVAGANCASDGCKQPNPTPYQRTTLRSPASNQAVVNKMG